MQNAKERTIWKEEDNSIDGLVFFLEKENVKSLSDFNRVMNKKIVEKKVRRYEIKMNKMATNCPHLIELDYKLYCKVLNKSEIKFSMFLYDCKGKQINFSGSGEMERFKRHLLQNCKNFLCECILENIEEYAMETIFKISKRAGSVDSKFYNALKR